MLFSMRTRSFLLGLGLVALSALGPLATASPAHAAPTTPALSPSIVDVLSRGLVVVERDKKPISVGTVLRGDGRVVTSLSAIGDVKPGTEPSLELRFPDGSQVKAKVGHADTTWDLALLIPQSGRYNEGLVASETDPTSAPVWSAMPSKAKTPLVTSLPVKGRMDARAKDSTALQQALDVDVRGIHVAPGTPIVDDKGGVVGVLVNACKAGTGACTPTPVGAPVTALRTFLMKTPETAKRPSAWLGIAGATAQVAGTRGVRVLQMSPGSPAEKAGFKTSETDGDVIVAVALIP